MNTFTLVFLILLVAGTAVQFWLARRQILHVQAHRSAVPEPFTDQVSLAAHQKAAAYTTARVRFTAIAGLVGDILLLAWTVGGGLNLLDQGWRSLALDPLTTGVGFLVSAVVLMSLLELPLAAYRTFVLEQHFGFNRTTPRLFLADLLKQAAIGLVLGVPFAYLVLWLMSGAGAAWWVYVWLVWLGFNVLLLWAYPAFIAPLFNTFTPLGDTALRERIEALLHRCGFSSRGVFVINSSQRSTHGNAYFTGIGNNKRIVFFDSLVDTLAHEETEAVLAHELGHFRLKHVRKHFIYSALAALAALALLGWLIDRPWFYEGLGMPQPSIHAALMLFMLTAPVFAYFLHPLLAALSRRHEFQADAFASEYTDPQHLIRALTKLYRDNASTLTPDPVYSAFYDSHPPAPIRIAHLHDLSNRQSTRREPDGAYPVR